MSTNEETQHIRDVCDKAAAAIGEHVDSVLIIVTFPSGQGKHGPLTAHYKCGRGNYYAQRGSVIEWIDATREIPQPPEPSEDWKEL